MAKYEVIGPLLVRGRRKGQTFEHEYTPEQEAALIEAGHVKRKKEKPANSPGAPQPPSGKAAQSSTETKEKK